MKAISLWQPWASLMAMGLKKIETRAWATRYRGPLYIHAAKKIIGWPSIDIQAVFDDIAFQQRDLPRGCLICKVDLIDCRRIYITTRPFYPERAFGDYTPGRYMWITQNLETFDPIPYRGSQGLFNVILGDQEPDLPKQQVMDFR
jgi:hypothetical protein